MELLPRFLFDGLVTGCLYALVAAGFGLIFQTTGVFHFAHAAVYSVAAYTAWQVSTVFGANLVVAVVAAGLVAALLGTAMYFAVYGPLLNRGGSVLVTLISALGLTAMVQGGLGLLYGETPQRLPFTDVTEKVELLPIFRSSFLDSVIIVTTVAVLGLLLLFLHQSRMGREIRAVGVDVTLARAFGFRVERAFALVFLIGSVLVAPSAVFGAVQTYVRPGSGVAVMLVASIAVFVGGVGNITGAIVTALLIGIAQNVSLLLVPGTWQNALTFGFFLVVMLLRPQGLLAGARRRGRGKPRSAEAMTPTPSVAENPKSLDQSEVRKL